MSQPHQAMRGHGGEATPEAIAFAIAALGGPSSYRFQQSIWNDDEAVAIASIVAIIRGFNFTYAGLRRNTAIASVPGIELYGATRKAVERAHFHEVPLFIAGYHAPKRIKELFDQDVVKDAWETEDLKVYSQGHANHCGHQAEWIAQKVVEKNVDHLVLCVHASHLPRAYITVLEALRRKLNPEGDYAPVIVEPVAYHQKSLIEPKLLNVSLEKIEGQSGFPLESDDPMANRTLSELEAVFGEYPRVLSYTQPKADGSRGDCMTLKSLRLYLDYIHRHHS